MRASAARIGALAGGIQLVWGALLAVSLAARSTVLVPHAGVAAYAWIAASGASVAAIVQIVAGRLSDRCENRVAFYVAGVALAVPALAWFYLAPNFAQLCVAFAALEIALNVASGPYQAAISDHIARDRRGRASAWTSAYQAIGNALGLVAAGFLGDLRALAAILCGGLAATGFITIRAVLTARGDASDASSHDRRAPAQSFRVTPALRVLLASRGLVNVGFYTLLGFLLFFIRDTLGITGRAALEQTALVFLCFTLCGIAGAALAARPAERRDLRAIVSLALGVDVAAILALAFASSLAIFYAGAAIAGIAWGAFATADWALALQRLPRRNMATAMGVWNLASVVPQILAPLVAGPLVIALDARSAGLGPRAALVFAALAFAAGASAIWGLPREAASAVEQREDPIRDLVRGARMT